MAGEKKKLIFVSGDSSDYLNISLLHGLKGLDHIHVIDYPRSEYLYRGGESMRHNLGNKGFTLYFQLKDAHVNRANIKIDLVVKGSYDLIVFGDIKSSFGLYYEYLPFLKASKTAVLDGSDDPSLFGDSGDFWRHPYYWAMPRPQKSCLYFKREWDPSAINRSRFLKTVPTVVARLAPQFRNLRPISFSIPESKIRESGLEKTKLLPRHIVDEEVRQKHLGITDESHVFDEESEYYHDLASSKYGITTKRSGWDCLRHYEIAANHTVICFKDLDRKPVNCAPHGLIPGVNCISYRDYDDLLRKIQGQSETDYRKMLDETIRWVKGNTTRASAIRFMSNFH